MATSKRRTTPGGVGKPAKKRALSKKSAPSRNVPAITIQQDLSAAAAMQREWLLRLADQVERGILSDSPIDRAIIASAVRSRASVLTPAEKVGNRNFQRKLPGDAAALMWSKIKAKGVTPEQAATDLEEEFGGDSSTWLRHYRESQRNSRE